MAKSRPAGLYSEDSAEALLWSQDRSLDSLPSDIAQCIKHGTASRPLLQQYLQWEEKKLFRCLLRVPGIRERLLGDSSFLTKLAIEVGMGVVTKLVAEYRKRPTKFMLELDLVFANVIMSLLADVMLIWIPAPRASVSIQKAYCHDGPSQQQFSLSRWLKGCPDNAFQVVPNGKPQYSVAQRSAAILNNGALLLIVGFVSSVLGVGLINLILAIRSLIGSHTQEISFSQGVVAISVAHGIYMATSGNIRYQVIAGIIEERGINKAFAHNHIITGSLIFVIRTINTYLGSAHWIVFIRYFRLQEA